MLGMADPDSPFSVVEAVLTVVEAVLTVVEAVFSVVVSVLTVVVAGFWVVGLFVTEVVSGGGVVVGSLLAPAFSSSAGADDTKLVTEINPMRTIANTTLLDIIFVVT